VYSPPTSTSTPYAACNRYLHFLGRRVTFLPLRHDLEVVGVAEDGRYLKLAESEQLAIYLAADQNPAVARSADTVIVRSQKPSNILAALQQAIREANPNLPVTRTSTMNDRIRELAMTQRIGASLLTWFSALALALSVLGIQSRGPCRDVSGQRDRR
jgi:hypothetical protein